MCFVGAMITILMTKVEIVPNYFEMSSTMMVYGPRGNNIQTWEGMKKVFLKKYQDYLRPKISEKKYFG
jgi:hypothetical protein